MLDMLKNEVKLNDVVVYVYPNDNGRTVALKGIVKGFNKKGCIIKTSKGNFNVKNVIKLKTNSLFNYIFNGFGMKNFK